jgi:hypothetical protein
MTVVSYVPCQRAEVRIVERPDGWGVTINGELCAVRLGWHDAYAAAKDLAQGIDEFEVEFKSFPNTKPRD